jgi:hypothetical protein
MVQSKVPPPFVVHEQTPGLTALFIESFLCKKIAILGEDSGPGSLTMTYVVIKDPKTGAVPDTKFSALLLELFSNHPLFLAFANESGIKAVSGSAHVSIQSYPPRDDLVTYIVKAGASDVYTHRYGVLNNSEEFATFGRFYHNQKDASQSFEAQWRGSSSRGDGHGFIDASADSALVKIGSARSWAAEGQVHFNQTMVLGFHGG